MPKLAVYCLMPGLAQTTVVWGSQRVIDQLEWYQTKKEKHRGFFVKKLARYAKDGFANWEGNDKPIRLEWDEVFRIGHDSTLFRIVGFHCRSRRIDEFIACDAFLKSGTKLNRSERDRIDAVAAIRASGQWERINDNCG